MSSDQPSEQRPAGTAHPAEAAIPADISRPAEAGDRTGSAGQDRSRGPRRWRLSTRLVLILLILLGLSCLVIGVSSYLAMRASLHSQLENQLAEASQRATSFNGVGAGTGASGVAPDETRNQDAAPNPLDAPGQGAGTLNARVANGQFRYAGVLDAEGTAVPLDATDRRALLDLRIGGDPVVLTLDQGRYLTVAETDAAGGVVITGLPLAPMHRTLAALVTVMVLVSLAALALVGLLGSWVIRRTMKPLERVSTVATDVSRLNLGSAQLPDRARVRSEDAQSGTEVGAVGHALNLLLDNVRQALADRQRSEDTMRDFVADASHELRTPLASIRGYADLLRWSETLSPEGEKSLGRITSQSQRMAGLVEDLLLLARLDAAASPAATPASASAPASAEWVGNAPSGGERPTHSERFPPTRRGSGGYGGSGAAGSSAEAGSTGTAGVVDLTELVLESVSDLQAAAPSHRWMLDLPDEPVVVRGDAGQLQRVMLNLLSNARKHTDPGTTVTTGLRISADGRSAEMTVLDDGPGIPEELQEKVFARFVRADAARSGEAGTTGLGLAIVEALVTAHGGIVTLDSRPGRTCFTVQLPLEGDGSRRLSNQQST